MLKEFYTEVTFEIIVLFPSNPISKIFRKKKLISLLIQKKKKKLVNLEVHCFLPCNKLYD